MRCLLHPFLLGNPFHLFSLALALGSSLRLDSVWVLFGCRSPLLAATLDDSTLDWSLRGSPACACPASASATLFLVGQKDQV